MAKISLFTQKIFGIDSGSEGVAVFGSIAANDPDFSFDPAAIQSEAWEGGWLEAIVAGTKRLPPFEDDNGVNFVVTSQLAYLKQEGIAEYDVGTNYCQKSIVKEIGTTILWGSLIDDNLGNPLVEGINWHKLGNLDLGTEAIIWSALQSFNSGMFALNGSSSGNLKINAPAAAGSSVITLPAGTTDFSATGGAGQIIKQSSVGAPLTVGTLGTSELAGNVQWTNFTPGFTGFSVAPTVLARYTIIGKTCFVSIFTTVPGTSNSSSFTITGMPITSAGGLPKVTIGQGINGGSPILCTLVMQSGVTTAVMHVGADTSSNNWSSSGSKYANLDYFYETV